MLNAESPCQMIVEECAKVKLVDSLAKTFAQFDETRIILPRLEVSLKVVQQLLNSLAL